jgi:hypothetical protein
MLAGREELRLATDLLVSLAAERLSTLTLPGTSPLLVHGMFNGVTRQYTLTHISTLFDHGRHRLCEIMEEAR